MELTQCQKICARSTYFEGWVLNKIVQQQDQVDVHMIQKCHADLGGVQVAATLSTGPVCVQWRQQQLISGALFHVGIGKRDISSEERALTGQNYLLKMKRHNCQVMCSALNGVNSWSPALFYMSASREAVFSERAQCQVHLICWRYITLMCVINQICVTRLKKRFQWMQSEKYNNDNRKQICSN